MTIGSQRFAAQEVFMAVIDSVEVKRVKELSPRDIEHDNPEFRRTDEMVHFLEQIYGRDVTLDDTVTVARFSQTSRPPDDHRAFTASAARKAEQAATMDNTTRSTRRAAPLRDSLSPNGGILIKEHSTSCPVDRRTADRPLR